MQLWGEKTVSWFDVWSIEHFFAGVSIGALVHFWHRDRINSQNQKYICLIFVLFLAYFWETVEFYLESGATGIFGITDWFQGTELWANRLITDPAIVLLGHFAGTRFPQIVWPARVFCGSWILVHIFIFPHSMYLHHLNVF